MQHNRRVQIMVAPEPGSGGNERHTLRELPADGREPRVALTGLTESACAAEVARLEARFRPRWVLPAGERVYPALLRHGIRLRRCHDLELAEGLLMAHDGLAGAARGLAAAHARAHGLPAPEDSDRVEPGAQTALFDPRGSGLPPGVTVADAAETVFGEQEHRLAAAPMSTSLRLLVAAESASGLAAAEMSHHGLPWHADTHRALLTELLGPRVSAGRPRALAELADRVAEAFAGQKVNPDHPPSVVKAFARVGIDVPSSRAWVLRDIDHPAVEPLLAYKELARLHSAHGWSWLDQWVSGGRFRPVFVVSGVVSGRWASRGGGALQVPRSLRVCVRADPGWALVVADAGQLEPRVLAALAGDTRLAAVSASADLYAGLAEDAFGSDRLRAKIAMLSAMYGGTSGEAGPLLAQLRQRFPHAVSYVEEAAKAGERGEVVRSRLGRTSPPPSEQWRALTGSPDGELRARRAAREWGRFTRNFVVQASAADWTAVLLALLRQRLMDEAPEAELVFFLHDEVIVHCPAGQAATVHRILEACAAEAAALVFGERCPVRFPLQIADVECYADAK